ncbi:MAG: hypothetical protein APR54_07730 [Candidatus Cloacimonas sp. SDB]|nr:MAG: hypothetical protein APR54_07730 [Candidatus Cloacimonas sp. SDB]
MKNTKLFVAIFFIFKLIVSCSTTKENQKEIFIKIYTPKPAEIFSPETLLVISNDSFGHIISGDYQENRLILLDVMSYRCFFYQDTQLISTFGTKGESPGEFNFMGAGSACFFNESCLVVYDPSLSRAQFFDFNGNLIDVLKLQHFSFDFGVLNNKIILSSTFGRDELIVVDIETGKTEKKYLSEININPQIEKIPSPYRTFEIASEDEIFLVTVDDYKIKQYSIKDSLIKIFGVEWEPIPIGSETINEILSRSGGNRDYIINRIREFKLPCNWLLYDNRYEILWVHIASLNPEVCIFDLFDLDGNYLKRVQLNTGNSFLPITLNDARFVGFDELTSNIIIYNVKNIYNVDGA